MIEARTPIRPASTAERPDRNPLVLVVDDDISVRESLESLIHAAGWHARSFGSARELLAHPRPDTPSCLLLDVELPDANGLDLQRTLASEDAHTPILFMTAHADVAMTVRAMKAGALEFLTKPLHTDALLQAIEQALHVSDMRLRRKAEIEVLRKRHGSLTPREATVMKHVIAGRLNKQIAGDLGISEITVKAHRGQVMRKMLARSVPELVRMAAKLGLGE
jgi:FixJ family two-component response regulator